MSAALPPGHTRPAMSEADLQASVIDLARRTRWLYFHDNDSRRNKAGLPDLLLVHPETGRVIFAELKSDTGKLRPEQKQWIDALVRGGHHVVTWRPEHWRAGVIQHVLLSERAA